LRIPNAIRSIGVVIHSGADFMPLRISVRTACIFATLVIAALIQPHQVAVANDTPTAVRQVRVPDRGLQPQVLVDTAGTLHLIYLGDEPASANVYYVRKSAGSEKFSRPLRVNSQPGSAIAIGSIRGAQLALGSANRVHVAWNGSGKAEPKGPVKYGNPMLYSRLADDGSAFEPQRNVIGEHYGLD
jgi:hypothetical protein